MLQIASVKQKEENNDNNNNDEDIDCININDLFGINKFRQLAIKQVKTFEFALKALEQINDDVLRYLIYFYRNTNDNNKFEIRASLYLIKQLLIQSQEKFKQNMNETNCVNTTIENQLMVTNSEYIKIKNELNLINSTAKQWSNLTSCELTSSSNRLIQEKLIETLNLQNLKLKEHVEHLQQKLNSPVLRLKDCETKSNNSVKESEEFLRLKEAYENLKIERKRLKCEKVDLLNQTKELYKTIEAKENEIRDFLRHYENKTRETANAVKRLIEHKAEIEKDKVKIQAQNQSLIEQVNQMKVLLESKEATIKKLQKQVVDFKTKSPRYSYGKESDYGYSSSKSRDTLCNSATIETLSNLKMTTSTTTTATTVTAAMSSNEIQQIDYDHVEEKECDDLVGDNLLQNHDSLVTKGDNLRESISSDCITSGNTNSKTLTPNANTSINVTTSTGNNKTYNINKNESKVKLKLNFDDEHNNYAVLQPNALNTSPTVSTSSYSSSSTSSNSDNANKDLHASLPIMAHSTILNEDYTNHQVHMLSVSLNIPNKNHDINAIELVGSTTPIVPIASTSSSSSSSSSSSVMLTSSYYSSDIAKLQAEHQQLEQIDKENIINLNELTFTKMPVDKWQQGTIKEWLEYIGMLPIHVKNCLKYVKNGKALIGLNENELEKVFFISNQMHKRKIKLALDELRYPEKCKYKKLSLINNKWICNVWLKDIGLKQYIATFKINLVDGRILASLQRKDLEKYFGIRKRIHQTSILLGIDLLRKYEFDLEKLKQARQECENKDIVFWTNDTFVDWLKYVSLNSYMDNLNESGIHGALVNDHAFNVDYLYEALRIDEARHQSLKKILDEEVKHLKKSKFPKQDSAFVRSISSSKNDKRIFTFRGSLGRALGRKKQRDISSPLIDDDTYKRIEYNHKIIDIKNFSASSAV